MNGMVSRVGCLRSGAVGVGVALGIGVGGGKVGTEFIQSGARPVLNKIRGMRLGR